MSNQSDDSSGCLGIGFLVFIGVIFFLYYGTGFHRAYSNWLDNVFGNAPSRQEQRPNIYVTPAPTVIPVPVPISPPTRLGPSLLAPSQQFQGIAPPPGMPDLRLNPPSRRRVRCFEQENMFGGGSSTVCEEF